MNVIDYKPRQKTKRSKETFKMETEKVIQALIITLSCMILVLSVIFITLTNQTAQKGYTLEQAKLKNEHLKDINTTLKTKITQSTAFSQIEDEEKIKEMQESEAKNYVSKEDNAVK